MFQKIDVYVVLVLTNITIGQLHTKLYDSDNGIPKFCICENLETHFHLVLFEHWHVSKEAFKHTSWNFNNFTWSHLVTYFHEYEIFRDNEALKIHLFSSLDTILIIIRTCVHSGAL